MKLNINFSRKKNRIYTVFENLYNDYHYGIMKKQKSKNKNGEFF